MIPRTSAVCDVELPMAYARVGEQERRRRALRALERVGSAERVRHRVSALSGGQQRVAPAVAS